MKAATDTSSARSGGFTLIELMVVVAIIGLIAAMGIPTLYRMLHREGLPKCANDVMEACSTARARAIISQQTAVLVFFTPSQGQASRFEVQSTGGGGWGKETTAGELSDDVAIETLKIDGRDCMDFKSARVRFFPNGTCDEMDLVLFEPKSGRRREITLEFITGLASVEADPGYRR